MSPDRINPQSGCPFASRVKLLPEAAPENVRAEEALKLSQASTHKEPSKVILHSEGLPSLVFSGPDEDSAR
jgi:hypothetical protein